MPLSSTGACRICWQRDAVPLALCRKEHWPNTRKVSSTNEFVPAALLCLPGPGKVAVVKILAIETATEACSAALLVDNAIAQEFRIAPREHAKIILPMIDSLLASAEISVNQLDAIAFGRGPGSFTGLRIATGITQGIAFSAGLPVAPVSTLAALAMGCVRQQQVTRVLAALDARMQEVYWAMYQTSQSGRVELQGTEAVVSPDQVTVPESGSWTGAGSGWETYHERLQRRCDNMVESVYTDQYPQAEDIARLAVAVIETRQTVAAEQAQPVYLRDRVADKPKPAILP